MERSFALWRLVGFDDEAPAHVRDYHLFHEFQHKSDQELWKIVAEFGAMTEPSAVMARVNKEISVQKATWDQLDQYSTLKIGRKTNSSRKVLPT